MVDRKSQYGQDLGEGQLEAVRAILFYMFPKGSFNDIISFFLRKKEGEYHFERKNGTHNMRSVEIVQTQS